MLTATGEHSVCCGWFADLLMGITSRYASIVAAFTIKHQDWSGKAFDTLNFLAPQPTTITIPYLTAYLSRELLASIHLPPPPPSVHFTLSPKQWHLPFPPLFIPSLCHRSETAFQFVRWPISWLTIFLLWFKSSHYRKFGLSCNFLGDC